MPSTEDPKQPDGTGPDASAVSAGSHAVEADVSPPRGLAFPVVGIGASAGGLEAFGQVLSNLPPDTGMAFVLVQHLDPQHESHLSDLLRRSTTMPVLTVEDGMRIEPNHVYVIPPNTSMVLRDGHLALALRSPGLHLPVDIFFCSLAETQGGRAVGVVLSGNASDGSQGLRAIKEECGITFAQDEATARYSGMPRSAIGTGAVDYILPPEQIGRELARLAQNRFLVSPRPGRAKAETLPEGDGDLKRIFALLHAATKVDFVHYKSNTMRRRISRRMMVLHIEDLAGYTRYVEEHPPELHELYRDLLISVTNFFRDPASFEALQTALAGTLEKFDGRTEPFRAWVPGCATGEEVYSIAIYLHELLRERKARATVQLFGTDINQVALDRARAGVYSENISQDVSPERLRRFFNKVDSGYQIGKTIRESCIFARHDITKDAPFAHLDLISCRNVLIYLDATLQRRVLTVLHYALNGDGLLLLGNAESTASAPDLFTPVHKQHSIFARRAAPARLYLDLSAHLGIEQGSAPIQRAAPLTVADLHKKVDRLIQRKYSPDAILIDSELNILEFRGQTKRYFDPAPGEASLNLLRMARESIVLPLRRAIQKAAESDGVVRDNGALLEPDGDPFDIDIEVSPIPGGSAGQRYYLVVFTPSPPPVPTLSDAAPVDAAILERRVRRLEGELAEARDYLRNLNEEYEAHAEELRAANEEARSSNEELQSTNEELGTTKEELQSTNEELTTVNDELQHRNMELRSINSDLKNLLSAVSVPILMVDHDLRVRRFNTAAEKLLDLGALDVGRPVGHLRGELDLPDLEHNVRAVLDSLRVFEEEVQTTGGYWYSLAIRPYRSIDNHIDGAVITFQDIDPLKRSVETAEAARDYAEGMIETVREPLIVLDSDFRVQRATSAFYNMFLVSHEETDGRSLFDLGNGQWNQPRLRELIGNALFHDKPFQDFEIEHDFPHIGHRSMRLNGRRIPQNGGTRTLLLAIEDVTERRELAEIRYQRLFETAKDGIVIADGETSAILDVNSFFLKLTGYTREALIGKPLAEAPPFRALPEAPDLLPQAREKERVRYDDRELATRYNANVPVELIGNLYSVGSQLDLQLNIRDIADRKRTSAALRESEQRFRLFVDSVRDYALFQLDLEGRITAWNPGAERLLGWREEEILGQDTAIVFTPEDIARGEPEREMETARREGTANDDRWHIRKDGSRLFASGVLAAVRDDNGNLRGFAKIMRDMTDRVQQENQLRRSVEEKSVLVSEIHHRVKNNLQVIVSLLSLQAGHAKDPQVLAAFEETESRVRAIAQIHERLYSSPDLAEIEFGAYLTQLVRELLAVNTAKVDAVKLDLHVTDMVLSIEQAIPLGLIANELILNSIKHAFRGGSGRLAVDLAYIPDNGNPVPSGDHDRVVGEFGQSWARLQVGDSGPGLPKPLDVSGARTMGLRLVNLLVAQLRGRLEVGEGPGAKVAVVFPLNLE